VVEDRSPTGRMLMDVAAYLVARLLLAAVLTVVIVFGAQALGIDEFPVVIALLFAIVIALPLGIWLFAPLRRRATASIAAVDERRRRDREQLQSRLRGEGSSDK
jgi:high-affinity Fe2+/Pb2+ permease